MPVKKVEENPRDFDGKPLRALDDGVDLPIKRGKPFNVVKELSELRALGAVIYLEVPNPPSGESVE